MRHCTLLRLIAFACTVHVAATAAAEDRGPLGAPLSLVHPDSLVGWDHGPAPAAGWTADGQTLHGGMHSTPLVAGWTIGDGVLRFTWRAQRGGVLAVQLPAAPEGDGLTAFFDESPHCGRILAGKKTLAAGDSPGAGRSGGHQAEIRRQGGRLSIHVDGSLLAEAKLPDAGRCGVSLHAPQGVVSIDGLTLQLPYGEPIFNGRDLTGWWSQKKQGAWSVKDGMLVGSGKGGNYLRSEQLHGNFVLSFNYKIKRAATPAWGFVLRAKVGPPATAWNCKSSTVRAWAAAIRCRSTSTIRRSPGRTAPASGIT